MQPNIEVSFEFFPPATSAMERTLWSSIERLAPLKPRFVSVTYGADGSTRERTHRVVHRIVEETGLVCAPHLTCVGADRDDVLEVARDYWRAGIRSMVALRGDPPQGTAYRPHPNGFPYAVDLVAGLKGIGDFEISVAAYPEVHPEAPSDEFDLDNLKRKIDAGATRAITQFFFDTERYLAFRDRCADAGIAAPIVPGILPITNFSRTLQFAEKCGASMPDRLKARFAGLDSDQDKDTQRMLAASVAIEQVDKLTRHGVNEFHFYTLNRAELTYAICHALGLRPEPARVAAV